MKTIQLTPFADIAAYTQGFDVVSVSAGFDGRIYVLLVDKEPERIDGMFVQSKTKDRHSYKVLAIEEDVVHETILHHERFNYHFVQPYGVDQLLLVGARTRYYGKDKYERNGKLFTRDGILLKEMLLGDGIQQVQVTERGTIWTSYFDEGVYGNYGWDDPIGAPGLIAWNIDGEPVFKNSSASIDDCYALNVAAEDDVWFYYYSAFQLGRIHKSRIDFVDPKISGSAGFLVYGDYLLFDGGYGKHDQYALLKSGSFRVRFTIAFADEDGRKIQTGIRDFRGDKLLLVQQDRIYIVRLRNLVT